MNLLNEAMEVFVLMDKTTQADGYGGVITAYTDGAEINAALSLDGGVEQLVGVQRGWNGSYTVVTNKSVVLMDGDIIKRKSDGMTFRVKSDGKNNKTPESASLDARAVKAEEYRI